MNFFEFFQNNFSETISVRLVITCPLIIINEKLNEQ